MLWARGYGLQAVFFRLNLLRCDLPNVGNGRSVPGDEWNAGLKIAPEAHAAYFIAIIKPGVQDQGRGARIRRKNQSVRRYERIEMLIRNRDRKFSPGTLGLPGKQKRGAFRESVILGKTERDLKDRLRRPVGGLRRPEKEDRDCGTNCDEDCPVDIFFHRVPWAFRLSLIVDSLKLLAIR
jgi:hypothetical protein